MHAGLSDFRSDTVTRPSPAMLEAMVTAPLGDDVLGDDPTVAELESFTAALFGKEASLFLPSGTMANQAALRVHCRPGDEALMEAECHVFLWEQGALAQLSGVQARPLPGRRGVVPIEDLERAVRPDDVHCPITSVLVLENTHASSGGSPLPLEHLSEARAFADRHGLAVHVDGARVANASVASGASLSELAAPADSITCCLSKGLGAPVGTMLAGSADFCRSARRARKVLGGAMRQAGVLAAAGLHALKENVARLTDDHARARAFGEALADQTAFELVPPQTNMVWLRAPGRAAALEAALAEEGVLCLALDPDQLRFVTHLDVDDDDVERAVAALRRLA